MECKWESRINIGFCDRPIQFRVRVDMDSTPDKKGVSGNLTYIITARRMISALVL